ncbi:beta-1,3-galactosyltransferase 1-like [Plakobranchus ocellatus]|uniref:Hexosyltransferase n=1 Tax=Plakobranchus ocellatus TaxID=259542 RepID=A0AAV4AHF5_9GAST|nr:beta-1,3-galactosyltransferase 1-like [Plakobranchus ocellatus]
MAFNIVLLRQKMAFTASLSILIFIGFFLYAFSYTSSHDCLDALRTLQTEENTETRLISNFLNSKLQIFLANISYMDSQVRENHTNQMQQDFYRRCFSRLEANRSELNSSSHPHFPGFIIENPNVCSSSNQRVDVLVYINSAVQNHARRHAIRHSWASQRAFTGITVKLVFILGQPATRREQLEVLSEQASSGDIVQARFEDTFRNLTFKALTFMAWANANCVQAQYIVKVDDDMFVDMFRVLFDIIPKIADIKYAMACAYSSKAKISRNPSDHWFVDETLLAGETHFPSFCPGFFSVYTGNLIPKLYEGSFSVKDFIPIDDVYMTGLSVKQPDEIKIINVRDQLSINERSDPEEEIKVNGHFEYIAFRVKSETQHNSLWTLRLSKLSDLEEKFSTYKKLFGDYGKHTVKIQSEYGYA